MEIPEHERRPIIEGLATIAVTVAEMGGDQNSAWAQVLTMMQRLRIKDSDAANVVREAAGSIASLPQPLDESAERLERGRSIRELLGLPEPADELAAALRAREWLENLASRLSADRP